MLDRAILYRKAFEKLSAMDNQYIYLPSSSEWENMVTIQKILKPFQTITNLFSGSDYPTANLYFVNVWKIQIQLTKLANSPDPNLKAMADIMREKFDKYWGDYSHVLSFGVILDPRYKLSFVRARYRELNDEAKVAVVKFHFETMFKEYSDNLAGCTNQASEENINIQRPTSEDSCSDYSSCDDEGSNLGERTEFDKYLAEPRVPKDSNFDILGYWKDNQVKFPVLAAMARDILSIPITTVASESSFSNGGRVLNKWRTRLLPQNSEALITTRSWLYGYKAYSQDDIEGDDHAGIEVDISEQPDIVQPSISPSISRAWYI